MTSSSDHPREPFAPLSVVEDPRTPGQGDAVRATVGVVAAWGAALLLAGLVALLTSPDAGEVRSAGSTRAQLAVQAVIFGALALLLVEGLRLARPPRRRDPLANPHGARVPGVSLAVVIAVGVIGAVLAQLAGPLVSAILPGVHDPEPVGHGLGIGSGTAADLGTVLVVVGLVPLGEELLFRGVLVGAWRRAQRPAVGILASTVLFGLAHVTVGGRSMLVTALLGAILAAALLWSGSLGAPVLVHCSVNVIALLDAGLKGPAPVVLAAVVLLVTTFVATRLSPLVSWAPAADTLSG